MNPKRPHDQDKCRWIVRLNLCVADKVAPRSPQDAGQSRSDSARRWESLNDWLAPVPSGVSADMYCVCTC